MTLEGRERAREAQLEREGPPSAPADFDPDATPKLDGSPVRLCDIGIAPSDTRIAGVPEPLIDESKVDSDRKQWHADDLGDRKLPIGSFIDIDGVLKKKDKKGRAYPCDPFGSKIISKIGTSVRSWNTRPPEVEPSIWWKFTPAERREYWQGKLKKDKLAAGNAEETDKAKGESTSSSSTTPPPPALRRPPPPPDSLDEKLVDSEI
jgi:hypothetical protein